MHSRFHYILIILVITSIYMIYRIGYYTIQQFQTTTFLSNMGAANAFLTEKNKEKEFLTQYIKTPAYQTQVAKAVHNKKFPNEEVINIIKSEEVEGNKERDSETVIAEAKKQKDDPTKNMTNPEKWGHLLKRGIQGSY